MQTNRYAEDFVQMIDIFASDSTMQRMAMHHIYEYEKGIRPMVLCTLSPEDCELILPKLASRHIDYYTKMTPAGHNVNLFFGRKACIDVVRRFLQDAHLHELDDEQDFIIGAMLGYDINMQCERYEGRKQKQSLELVRL